MKSNQIKLVGICVVLSILLIVFYLKNIALQHSERYIALNDELTQKLAANIDLSEKLIHSELRFHKIYSELSVLKHATLEKFDKLIIKTDEILLTNKAIPSLSAPNGCEANRGVIKQYVAFDREYRSIPSVFAGFTLIDFADGTDHRLKLNVTNISTKGFEITLVTWCDTRMSKVKADWISFGY
jgi:hypothetical protein